MFMFYAAQLGVAVPLKPRSLTRLVPLYSHGARPWRASRRMVTLGDAVFQQNVWGKRIFARDADGNEHSGGTIGRLLQFACARTKYAHVVRGVGKATLQVRDGGTVTVLRDKQAQRRAKKKESNAHEKKRKAEKSESGGELVTPATFGAMSAAAECDENGAKFIDAPIAPLPASVKNSKRRKTMRKALPTAKAEPCQRAVTGNVTSADVCQSAVTMTLEEALDIARGKTEHPGRAIELDGDDPFGDCVALDDAPRIAALVHAVAGARARALAAKAELILILIYNGLFRVLFQPKSDSCIRP